MSMSMSMSINHHKDECDDNQAVAWMRPADPASDVSPLPAWQLERLKENAMNTTQTTAPTRSRRRLIAVAGVSAAAAAAAAAIIAGVVITGPSAGGGVTALNAPSAGGPAAACVVPSAEGLASSTLAFRGTVTSIADSTVTFRVDDVFTGDADQTVTVPQGDPNAQIDGAAPVFEDGTTYLVSTTDDIIRSCGLTGADSSELNTLYEAAF